VCRRIMTIVHNLGESMVNVCWRAALGFYFGKRMYARVTSVIMQPLEYSLKKVKSCIPTQETCCPVYRDGSKESVFSPFFKRGLERHFVTKSKYLIDQSAWKACNDQGLDMYVFYADGKDLSDEEMANNKFVRATSLGASDFHSRLLADTAK
jgi:hypothetical protein